MGKNNITQGEANCTGMPRDPKVNKAECLNFFSINMGCSHSKHATIRLTGDTHTLTYFAPLLVSGKYL